MAYKDNCGFRRLNCCSFKEPDCVPEKCDMYNLEFTSKAIKERKDYIEKRVLESQKDTLNMQKVKEMLKKESADKENPEVIEYKKTLKEIADLSKGSQYLQKAYIYCKRTGK